MFDSIYHVFLTGIDELKIQFANGSNIIEIYYNGEWGSVCGNGWSIEDAKVACRQLGYPPDG